MLDWPHNVNGPAGGGTPRDPAHNHNLAEVSVDTGKFSAPRATHPDVDERIRLDATAHLERTYSEHVEAARREAAPSYREEIRALMRAGKL